MGTRAIKVSMYIHENDQWEHRPLYIALLTALSDLGVSGGTVLHAVAGFTKGKKVETTSLIDTNTQVPLVVQFIDLPEKVASVLPTLINMCKHRLTITEEVDIVNRAIISTAND